MIIDAGIRFDERLYLFKKTTVSYRCVELFSISIIFEMLYLVYFLKDTEIGKKCSEKGKSLSQ